MRKIIFLFLTLLFLSLAYCNKSKLHQVSTSPNAFDNKLLIQFKNTNDNIVLSPYSIYTALALSANGAKGQTQNEILSLIAPNTRLTILNEKIKKANLMLLNQGEGNTETDIKVANGLFFKSKPSPTMTSIANNFYAATIQQLTSSDQINSFVSKATNNKISNIVDESILDSKMVIINAIYMKASWLYPFEVSANTMEDFHTSDNKVISTNFMNKNYKRGEIEYFENDEIQMVRLPYANLDLNAVLVVPKKSNVNDILDHLNIKDYENSLNREFAINLKMPKFRIESKLDLKSVLMSLGIKTSFSDRADFSKMTSERIPLKIDKVLHQTYLDINENGTEAAAATVVPFLMTSSAHSTPPIVKDVIINKPFIFIIEHKQIDQNLFIAKIEHI